MAKGDKNTLPQLEVVVVKLIEQLKLHKLPSPKTGKVGNGVFARPINEALRAIYGESFDCVAATTGLIEKGIIEGHPVKGGFMLYLAGEGPRRTTPSADDLLAAVGLGMFAK